MIRKLGFTLASIVSTALAPAAVTEWGGAPGGSYSIDGSGNVEILAQGTFKFESESSGVLGNIGSITINDSVTGTVTVYIERSTDNNAPGAVNVGSINLTNSNATPVVGNLAELRITGDLGTANPSVLRNITGPVVVDDIVDDLTIDVDVTSTGSITVDQATGDITISRNIQGDIEANSLGNMTITSSSGGSGGNITIHSAYSSILFIDGRYGGVITIGGNLTGTVNIDSNLIGGQIIVDGDMAAPGRIIVAGQANNSGNPPIHILGSITGTGASLPPIEVGGELNGTIAIDGSLANGTSEQPCAFASGLIHGAFSPS